MKQIKVSAAGKAMAGRCITGDPDTIISDVTTDSRTAQNGTLFFALPGEHFDGHDFLGDAINRGCSALVVCRKVDAHVLASAEKNNACIVAVENTLAALRDLSAYYLGLFNIKRFAVTGSTGKTTTKDMLACILKERHSIISNYGNQNNQIGLPLTAFRVNDDTEIAVFEMGMDRPMEIHQLAEIVRPEIGVITNIGLSHIEHLKSRENILKAKLEIMDFMEPGSVLVIDNDDDLLSLVKYPDHINVLKVGWNECSDLKIDNIDETCEGKISFTLSPASDIWGGKTHLFCFNASGLHNIKNAALALGAASCVGISAADAQKGLAHFSSSEGRLNIFEGGGICIIDDTYNASPDSMKAAIQVLKGMKGNRKLAVLGDMFELGDKEKEYHFEIGEYASKARVDVVISVGKNATFIAQAAREGGVRAIHFETKDNLSGVLTQWIRKGDVILVKGSRGMGMEDIVDLLKNLAK